MAHSDFNWDDQDYTNVFKERVARLKKIRADAAEAEALGKPNPWDLLKRYYRNNPADFVEDWGVTVDQRRLGEGKAAVIPFILFPKQREAIAWLHDRMTQSEPGVIEKSRDMGISYVFGGFGVWAFCFLPGSSVGYSSYEESKVDAIGNLDSWFEKVRAMLRMIPKELLPVGYEEKRHANFERITNPETGAVIKGEVGDNTGRGGRSTIYFVDEFASYAHQDLVDASLSQNTPARIYASTPRGMGNLFYRKRHDGNHKVFRFHWTDDPRKDMAWYKQQCRELEPEIVAAEIDIDYTASVSRVIIPAEWIMAAQKIGPLVGRHWPVYGHGVAGLDVGAGGQGKSVYCARFGPFVDKSIEYTERDPDATAMLAKTQAMRDKVQTVNYDEIGVGAGTISTLRTLKPEGIRPQGINVGLPASELMWPDYKRSNEKFANVKAEIWWLMRDRFKKTYQMYRYLTGEVTGAADHPLDELIVLDPLDYDMAIELSTPVWEPKATGKIAVESKKDLRKRGIKSPDHAEALSLTFAPEVARMKSRDIQGLI